MRRQAANRRRNIVERPQGRHVVWCGHTIADAEDLMPWLTPSTTMFWMIGGLVLTCLVVLVLTIECNYTWDQSRRIVRHKGNAMASSRGKGCLSGTLAGVDVLGFVALAFLLPVIAACCFTFGLSVFINVNPRSAGWLAQRLLCLRVVEAVRSDDDDSSLDDDDVDGASGQLPGLQMVDMGGGGGGGDGGAVRDGGSEDEDVERGAAGGGGGHFSLPRRVD